LAISTLKYYEENLLLLVEATLYIVILPPQEVAIVLLQSRFLCYEVGSHSFLFFKNFPSLLTSFHFKDFFRGLYQCCIDMYGET
jgi:hypothetical protein